MEYWCAPQMVLCAILLATVFHAELISGIPLDEFFPFGLEVGDSRLPKILDATSPPIQLAIISFPYFGQDHSVLFVNANGDISFLRPVSTFVPQAFPLDPNNIVTTQVIAPFWADSDTRPEDGGDVWYRETNEAALLQRARNMIRGAFINLADFEPLSLFIATWDHVGVYPQITETTNTFQCVLVTDGTKSFVMFLYADGLIQWLWSLAHFEIPAQVGFNAGDGVRFFSHPDSMTTRLSTVYETSNIDTPGVWLFRVDHENIVAGGCTNDLDTAQITISPRIGNMLGGTGILISGPCFVNRTDSDSICSVDSIKGELSFISKSVMLCVTPSLKKIGAVTFLLKFVRIGAGQIQRNGNRGPKIVDYESTFISVSPDRSYAVDVNPSDLLLSQGASYTVTWSPETLLPPYIIENSEPFTIDIEMYQQKFSRGASTWSKITSLISNHENNGEATVTIPSMSIECQYPPELNEIMFNVCPIVLKVSVSERSASTQQSILSQSAGMWTGVAFLKSSQATDINTRTVCDQWAEFEQIAGTGISLTNALPACPPTEFQARIDSDFEREGLPSLMGSMRYSESSRNFFHPNLLSCFIQVTPNEEGQGQQCCYDNSGNLRILAPAGGSADLMSPKSDYNMHLLEDLVPYVVCCKSSETTSNCGAYYEHRPSGEAIQYNLPVPACIYGDPHIVTLDGLKYTFNGKGEFTLIETDDNSFTLQGRMEQVEDASGEDALGTVFTAIVAIQEDTSTVVQFEIRPNGIRTIMDGLTVEFDDISEQNFINVTITDKSNGSVLATFSGGVSLELKVENGIISVMLVNLPNHLKGHTRGLMGNFNGIPSDDLIPKSETEPISPDSSLEEIHTLFGMTWIINDVSNTRFTYHPGDSWTEFYDPTFLPVFEPTFEDPTLEEEAKSVCGEDKFCLFDVAATKRIEIGVATMNGSQSFNEIVELSEPIVCDPICENGVCVGNNTCSCAEGYSGNRCTHPVMSECGDNICENNGTCVKHVATIMCMCPDGYIGSFCQEKEPPFHIRFINSSPRVSGNNVLIDFVGSRPIISASCSLTGQPKQDCISKWLQYEGLPTGSFIFKVEAISDRNEKAVERRLIHITDKDFCVVSLINEGITVDGTNVAIQFQGRGPITSYICILDGASRMPCRSPVHYKGLEVGGHRIRVLPQGCNPRKVKSLSMKFFVI